jgi:hypothetical protein
MDAARLTVEYDVVIEEIERWSKTRGVSDVEWRAFGDAG